MHITRIIRQMPNGATKPYVVECNNGIQYYCKFPGNPDGTRVLINEYVCASLAKLLKLPIPDFELVYWDSECELSKCITDIENTSGTTFCSRSIERAGVVPSNRVFNKASNRDQLYKILVFDLLIGNNDRNPGNILINLKNNSIVMIDHSHVFIHEAIWDKISLKNDIDKGFVIDDMNKYYFERLLETINWVNEDDIKNFKMLINKVDKDIITKIVDSVPSDWNLNNEDKKMLIEFINYRFRHANEIFNLLKIERGD